MQNGFTAIVDSKIRHTSYNFEVHFKTQLSYLLWI